MISIKCFLIVISLELAISQDFNRLYMDSCDMNGFSCNDNLDEVVVKLICNDITGQYVELWLYHFRAIPNISTLTIQNCESVKLNLRCATDVNTISSLNVFNVKNLQLVAGPFTQNPQKIHLENITWIEEIPINCFTQLSQKHVRGQCFQHPFDLDFIFIKNVSIGTIQSGAFFHLENMKNFNIQEVKINKIETEGIHVRITTGNLFVLHDTTVKEIEKHAIYVFGRKMLTVEDDFMEFTSIGRKTLCFKSSNFSNPQDNWGFSARN